jgi:hypothetical protein
MYKWYPFKETEWDGSIHDSEVTQECVLVSNGDKYYATKTKNPRGSLTLLVLDTNDNTLFSLDAHQESYIEFILKGMGFQNGL